MRMEDVAEVVVVAEEDEEDPGMEVAEAVTRTIPRIAKMMHKHTSTTSNRKITIAAMLKSTQPLYPLAIVPTMFSL